jgi:Fanconi-associated nuclease 1
MTYPDYSIAKETIVYQSRQDLIDYSDACHLETKTLTAVEKKSHAVVLNELLPEALYGFEKHLEKTCNLPAFLRNQTAGHVYTRCLSHSVTSLEQSKNYEKAVTILQKLLDQKIFCHNARGKWYERLVIDLGHLKKNEKVAEVLKDAMSDFLVKLYLRYTLFCKAKKILKNSQVLKDASTEFANVEKSKHVTIECTILPKSVQGKRTMFTDPSGTTILPVEEVALRHYKTEGGFSHGLHSESVIYHSLMNILLWDVIYTPMPDAFRFFHQNLPLDFVHEDFYLRRQESIDARLDELKNMSDGQVNSEIDRIWMRYNNTSCLVSWDLVSAQTLKELASCIGIHVLVPIMKRMICNFRLNRSGFPDLILWDPSTFRVKAVEVKGPTDSLSAKQILWLDFFNSCGLPCEVCYVKAKSKP